jgi:hypothetical protein
VSDIAVSNCLSAHRWKPAAEVNGHPALLHVLLLYLIRRSYYLPLKPCSLICLSDNVDECMAVSVLLRCHIRSGSGVAENATF